MENYVPEDDEHVYIVAFLNEQAINHTRFISSEVTNISKRNESVADMEISLTVCNRLDCEMRPKSHVEHF